MNIKSVLELVGYAMFIVIFLSVVAIVLIEIKDSRTQTESFIGEVCGVSSTHIVFTDGTVIFAHNINRFEWQIGKRYNITVGSCDILGMISTEIVQAEKEEVVQKNGIRKHIN